MFPVNLYKNWPGKAKAGGFLYPPARVIYLPVCSYYGP